MFYPVLPPQPPANPEYSHHVYHLAEKDVVKIKTDRQKLIVENEGGRRQKAEGRRFLFRKQFSPFLNNSDQIKNLEEKTFSPLSTLENLRREFSPQKTESDGELNHTTDKKPVLPEVSTSSVVGGGVNLQESGGKLYLSVGKKKSPIVPIQNIIEFKLRNPENKPPTKIEFTPVSPTPTIEKTIVAPVRVLEVTADRQDYDERSRIVTAEGKVVVRFDGAVINADSLQISLDNLMAVGEGNVVLTRGNQILSGERFTYNFIQDSGDLENGKGELYLPTTGTDFAFSSTLPTDVTAGGVLGSPLSSRVRANQPITDVNSPGEIQSGVSGQSGAKNVSSPTFGGEVKRLRFEAQRIEFYPRGFEAQDARITNDPFSPPELEIRADKVTVTREAPLIDRIVTQGQRLVFDQNVQIPIPINNRKIDRRQKKINPTVVSFGFDKDRRGGVFVERSFEAISNNQTRWIVTPQFYLQRATEKGKNFASLFGVNTKLNASLGAKTVVEGRGELTSFDFNDLENNLQGSLRLRHALGNINPYTVSLESSYRDLLYNGSLGYQTVQSSIGGIITSPIIPLGTSGINLSYQAGAQYIDANTDRQDLLSLVRKNDRISLGRLQGSVALSSGINLWKGKPLASTANEGLKYTPNVVVPYLQAIAGVTGTTSYYSSGDNQSTLIATIGLVGQVGHFSRPYLDYTAFNVSYSQGFNSGLSPFFFDRSVDNKVLSAGISQQIYGPFRLSLQTSINLDTGKAISTDYIFEYSRRTYGITLRYNPILELGAFSIRISDFNWLGGTDPFSDGRVKSVVGGVVRQDN